MLKHRCKRKRTRQIEQKYNFWKYVMCYVSAIGKLALSNFLVGTMLKHHTLFLHCCFFILTWLKDWVIRIQMANQILKLIISNYLLRELTVSFVQVTGTINLMLFLRCCSAIWMCNLYSGLKWDFVNNYWRWNCLLWQNKYKMAATTEPQLKLNVMLTYLSWHLVISRFL